MVMVVVLSAGFGAQQGRLLVGELDLQEADGVCERFALRVQPKGAGAALAEHTVKQEVQCVEVRQLEALGPGARSEKYSWTTSAVISRVRAWYQTGSRARRRCWPCRPCHRTARRRSVRRESSRPPRTARRTSGTSSRGTRVGNGSGPRTDGYGPATGTSSQADRGRRC